MEKAFALELPWPSKGGEASRTLVSRLCSPYTLLSHQLLSGALQAKCVGLYQQPKKDVERASPYPSARKETQG